MSNNRITLIGHIESESKWNRTIHLPESGMILEIPKKDFDHPTPCEIGEEELAKLIYQMINNGLDDKDARFDNGLCRDLADAILSHMQGGDKMSPSLQGKPCPNCERYREALEKIAERVKFFQLHSNQNSYKELENIAKQALADTKKAILEAIGR